ncbi:hypothetical protein Taro_014674 [Colocasia esculenta]|uniref:Laccase n=1 Tax=Colocasia esculenta TaxID=4460 RepID=A0A843UIU2_COLES|nr:hypothetical protein [Colocasia esculenta]
MVLRENWQLGRALVVVLLYWGFFCLRPVWSRSHRHVFNIEEAPYTRLCQTKNILTVNGKYPGPTIRAYRGDTVIVEVYNRANTNITLHWYGYFLRDHLIEEATYTRLCRTKSILTVNGQFPGPTIYARHGDTVVIKAFNRADQNITLHWHGVKQPRNPWSDGPAYITQCPIKPGASFTYRIVFSTEEGTLWWHAHSDWARATVHGAIVVYPELGGAAFPFPRPHQHFLIVLGEWWKRDVNEVLGEMLQTGGVPNVSDAFTINGEPGDLYPCSKRGMQ